MDLVLLAAGNSTRFGANKLLYELDGEPMYQYALERAVRLQISDSLRVTGHIGAFAETETAVLYQRFRIFRRTILKPAARSFSPMRHSKPAVWEYAMIR